MENCKRLADVINKLSKCVNSLHKSGKLSEAVKKAFGKTLKRRCVTRWNTNFQMAESAIDLPCEAEGSLFQ